MLFMVVRWATLIHCGECSTVVPLRSVPGMGWPPGRSDDGDVVCRKNVAALCQCGTVHNVGGGILLLLFLLGWLVRNDWHVALTPSSAPSGGIIRLCDDARYPHLWLAAD